MTLNFEANKHTNDIRFQRNDQIAKGRYFKRIHALKRIIVRIKKV